MFYVLKSQRYGRIAKIIQTLSLIGKHNIKDDLQKIYQKVSQVTYDVENLKKVLERMKEQNVHLRVSLNRIFAILLLVDFIISREF